MITYSDPPMQASYGPARSMCTGSQGNFAREDVDLGTAALIPYAIEHPAQGTSWPVRRMPCCHAVALKLDSLVGPLYMQLRDPLRGQLGCPPDSSRVQRVLGWVSAAASDHQPQCCYRFCPCNTLHPNGVSLAVSGASPGS